MIVWWVRGKISGLFCAVLCATIVHSAMHTHMNRPNSCLVVRFSFSLVILCVTVYPCRFSISGLFCVIVHLCMCMFVVLDLVFAVSCQAVGWKERLQNHLFCVE